MKCYNKNAESTDIQRRNAMSKYKCKICGVMFESDAGVEPICPVCKATGKDLEVVLTSTATVSLFDGVMKYPRICAHRGFNSVAPENTMPAFGAAIALGAEEIEFDLWPTTDGEIVVCHDPVLDRVSTGSGKIYEHSYAELLELDFGVKHGERFKGLKIPTFEEVLQKFSRVVIMNIHVKIWDLEFKDRLYNKIIDLVRKYQCEKHIYFMTASDKCIKELSVIAPDLKCCLGWSGEESGMEQVDRAIAAGAYKIQFFKPHYDKAAIDKAHANGIICNMFWSDDPAEAREMLDMGIDTILTNDFLNVYNGVEDKLLKYNK